MYTIFFGAYNIFGGDYSAIDISDDWQSCEGLSPVGYVISFGMKIPKACSFSHAASVDWEKQYLRYYKQRETHKIRMCGPCVSILY